MTSLDFRPRLRHCTLIDDPAASETTLVVGKDYFTLTRVGDRTTFLHLKSLLDGRHSVAEIGARTGLAPENVAEVVSVLDQAGLFQARNAEHTISADAFKTRVEESSSMWRRQIGLHPLFGGLADGTFRREVFIGFLLETYHYVRLLPRALANVAETMRNPVYREIVLEYADEEMDHYLKYKDSLELIDRLRGHIPDSHPTVGTLSLVRNFESIGRRSELSLICCLQLIEARPEEMDSAAQDFQKMAERYGLGHVVGAFIDHMRADIELGHSGLLDQALMETASMTSEAAHEAVNDMHDVKHCFDVFHDSIIGYYGDISNYIPRPRVDFFAL